MSERGNNISAEHFKEPIDFDHDVVVAMGELAAMYHGARVDRIERERRLGVAIYAAAADETIRRYRGLTDSQQPEWPDIMEGFMHFFGVELNMNKDRNTIKALERLTYSSIYTKRQSESFNEREVLHGLVTRDRRVAFDLRAQGRRWPNF